MSILVDNLSRWLMGARVTAEVTAVSAVFGAVMSFVAGLAMLSRFRTARAISRTYTELFRGTSVLVQMFWFVFAFPQFGLVEMTPFQGAVAALSLNIGAYGAEVVRGAVQAVPRGQIEAAVALNMTRSQQMVRVILPQAVVSMLPPFGNLLIQLLKASALVHLIFLSDLTRVALNVRNLTGEVTATFTVLLVFYFVLAYAITLGVRALERRVSRGLEVGVSAA